MAEIRIKVTLDGVDEARAQLEDLASLSRLSHAAADPGVAQAIHDLASARVRSMRTPDSGGADREHVLHDLNEIRRLAATLGAVETHG